MILFLCISLLRILFIQLLSVMWWRIPGIKADSSQSKLTFSILLPVRNESDNIIKLLQDLEHQDYPINYFEVLVIDDHSEDNTVAFVESFIKDSSMDIRLIKLAKPKGKKAAITVGISHSKFEYILATDGDCKLPETWIKTFAKRYDQPDSPNMITGPVLMSANNLFTRAQALEFSALIGFGASSLQMGFAGTCNGANISYKKAVFHEVEGYKGNDQIPSGDDEFLMFKIFRKHNGTIAFLKEPGAVVTTPAKQNISDLFNQRIRWSSKWKFHKSGYVTSIAILFFSDYVILSAAVAMAMLGVWEFSTIASVLILRWLTEYYYIMNVMRFLGAKSRWSNFLFMQIIYPLFVVFLGLASIFGIYRWKGRVYK